MTDLQRNTDHQCQCAQCRASRALDVAAMRFRLSVTRNAGLPRRIPTVALRSTN